MKKILAIIPSKVDGCTYHRIEIPLHHLTGFDLAQVNQLDAMSDIALREYEIVWFNRLNGIVDSDEQINRLKSLGIKYVIDFDDLWNLPQDHLLYGSYRYYDIPGKLIRLAKNADAIITTHSYLANKLKKFNNNIVIAPNAIDPEQPQWKTESNVLNEHTIFGWCGGVNHWCDLELLTNSLRLARDNNYGLALGGYNPSAIWDQFENIFTGGKYDRYVRIDGQDVYNYGRLYDFFTTVLIPLKKNEFNRCKSELKMLEAGFKKKAVIVSNIHPYSLVINDSNCLKVDEAQGNGWFKAMKKISESKFYEADLGEALYETVKDKYHIKSVNKIREELFNSL
jgi:glycosyltransferase involved in cell wall biosynthesis